MLFASQNVRTCQDRKKADEFSLGAAIVDSRLVVQTRKLSSNYVLSDTVILDSSPAVAVAVPLLLLLLV